MATQAMWVHGNTARTQETTDKLMDVPYREHSALLGYPEGGGITFRGRDDKRVFEKFLEVKCYANRLTIIRIIAR